ncbi:MAG TPA: galactokinase [Polyangiaceae bacterium]
MGESSGKVNALSEAFRERFQRQPEIFSAPGRVNLIGEHTDYNGGLVLPMAIGERTRVAAAARSDRVVRAYSQTLRKDRTFSLDDPWKRRGKWLDYVEGVARVLGERGVPVAGADLYISSDVPPGAGLSSSAALELAVGLALTTLAKTPLSPRDLAAVGQRVEHEYIGAETGIMDQLVSALGRQGHALLIDCRSREISEIPIPELGAKFVVCDTRVRHALANSEYNKRRAECQEAVELLRRSGFALESLRDVTVERLDEALRLLPDPLSRRVRHVVRENARTSAAVDALSRRHLVGLGRLLTGSHASLRDDYEVSCPELDHVVDSALQQKGVLGARMTGGGFGGSALLLVQAAAVDRVEEAVFASFHAKFKSEPAFSVKEAGDGMRKEILARA